MTGEFEGRRRGAAIYQAFPPWERRGIVHGFMGRSAEPQISGREALMDAFGVQDLFFLDQVHGAGVLDLRAPEATAEFAQVARRGLPYPEGWRGDAVLLDGSAGAAPRGYAFALRTADCLPLLLSAGNVLALVHAGWRGLAAGIIEKVVSRMDKLSPGSQVSVLIGPAACAKCYEVEQEVLAGIGAAAVFQPSAVGKFMLSLEGTARKMIEKAAGGRGEIFSCPVCTITEPDFHSFRREGAGGGRNLSFVVL